MLPTDRKSIEDPAPNPIPPLMITEIPNGDLFTSKADIFINPVNCAGVMGKGLAAQFKQRFPHYFDQYKCLCERGLLNVGEPYVTYTPHCPKWIISFPTKRHWKERSQLKWIQSGMARVSPALRLLSSSMAVPALGCGEGGLAWDDVRPILYAALKPLAEAGMTIELYPPQEKAQPQQPA